MPRNKSTAPRWAHQAKEFLIGREKRSRAYIWPMRSGKSRSVIDVGCYQFKHKKIEGVIVVAPNGVHLNWQRNEIPTWCSLDFANPTFAWETPKRGFPEKEREWEEFLVAPGLRWMCINMDMKKHKCTLDQAIAMGPPNYSGLPLGRELSQSSGAIRNRRSRGKRRRAYLYTIRLPVNDYAVAYIGVTKRPHDRFGRHAVNGDNSLIGAAVKECGAQSVLFEALEYGGSEYIYAREVELIAKLGTRWPAGYNLAPGGHGGRNPLPRTREKIGAAHRGKIVSAETRAKQAAAKLGRKQSPELIAKRTAGQKGRPLHPNTRAAISRPRPLAVRQRIALGVERSWIGRHANG